MSSFLLVKVEKWSFTKGMEWKIKNRTLWEKKAKFYTRYKYK